MSRCDSAAMVPKTSDDLPDPETPVNTVSRRLGSSTLTSLRLLTRAPWTRISSCESAACFDICRSCHAPRQVRPSGPRKPRRILTFRGAAPHEGSDPTFDRPLDAHRPQHSDHRVHLQSV